MGKLFSNWSKGIKINFWVSFHIKLSQIFGKTILPVAGFKKTIEIFVVVTVQYKENK